MSDHTVHSDIVRRLQTRLNQVIPGNYGNTNVCQFRDDYSDYDFLSHGCGPLGYSGRLWESPPDARRRLADALARFKSYRHLLLGDYTCELADHDDRHGHEVHRWQDGGQELVLEFNADGPETASMTLS
jgi:hypothetical protein